MLESLRCVVTPKSAMHTKTIIREIHSQENRIWKSKHLLREVVTNRKHIRIRIVDRTTSGQIATMN